MAAAFAFDQGAFATLGLRRTDGTSDAVAMATVGLMCLPAPVPPIPPTPPGPVARSGGGGGGGGGGAFFIVPPCQEDGLESMVRGPAADEAEAPNDGVERVVEDVPLDLAIDTVGDITEPFGRLVADLALLFKKKPRK